VVTKTRPAVVLSTEKYHQERPDVIAGILTTKLAKATTETDYVLEDWKEAGLKYPTAFRAFIGTEWQDDIQKRLGVLSERDWREVQKRVLLALELDQADEPEAVTV